MPPTGDLAHNTGMCPDWESNQQPFGPQAGAQNTEPYLSGPNNCILKNQQAELQKQERVRVREREALPSKLMR